MSQDAVVTGTAQIAPKVISIQLDSNGAIPGGTTIYANDELTPSGTTYTLSVTDQTGRGVWQEIFQIAGASPINLNNSTPVSGSLSITFLNPVLQNPSGPQSITGFALTVISPFNIINGGFTVGLAHGATANRTQTLQDTTDTFVYR